MASRVDGHIARSLALLVDEPSPLSDLILQEALLPTVKGGLGLPCLSDIRAAAHIASVLTTVQQWRRHVADLDPLLASWAQAPSLAALLTDFQPTIQAASEQLHRELVFPATPQAAITFSAIHKLQQALTGYVDLNTVTALKQQHVTNLVRAQYLSKTSRGARAFLNACPTDAGLYISNADMVIALRMWMRLPLLPLFDAPGDLTCFCQDHTLLTEEHILNCNGFAARDVRHDTITLCFQEMLQAAVHRPVLLEPRASTQASVHHRFDLSVAAFDAQSRNLKLDITVRNPQAKSMVVRASAASLVAATEGVNDKLRAYSPFLVPSDWFMPLALESFGGLHQNIFTLLSICAHRVGNVPPDSASFLAPSFSTYWLQRISCTLMRENARLVSVIVSGCLRNCGVLRDDAPVTLLPGGLLAAAEPGQAL
jgi:hypothetical protein